MANGIADILSTLGKFVTPQTAQPSAATQMMGTAAQNPAPRPTPAPAPTPDPMSAAVEEAKQRLPWVGRIPVPIKLTSGKGPYYSETYMPNSEENPHPGHFTIELRDPRLVNDPKQWLSTMARESIDYMAQHDNVYKQTANQFRQSMTPQQLERPRKLWQQEQASGEKRSFEDFMRNAEVQEWVGGYVLGMPGWKPEHYTPQQRQMLDKLKNYMWAGKTPEPLRFPLEEQ